MPRVILKIIAVVPLAGALFLTSCSSAVLSGSKESKPQDGEQKPAEEPVEESDLDAAAPPDEPEWMPLKPFECPVRSVTADEATFDCVLDVIPPDAVRKTLTSTWSVLGNSDRPAARVTPDGLFRAAIVSEAKALRGRRVRFEIKRDGTPIYRRTRPFEALLPDLADDGFQACLEAPVAGVAQCFADRKLIAAQTGPAPAPSSAPPSLASRIAALPAKLYYANYDAQGRTVLSLYQSEGADEGKTTSVALFRMPQTDANDSCASLGISALVPLTRYKQLITGIGHIFDYGVKSMQQASLGGEWQFQGSNFCVSTSTDGDMVPLYKWVNASIGGSRHYTTTVDGGLPGYVNNGIIGYVLPP